MIEQWQELKETIVELRDNDGTGTQQEVCKFLANYMGVLEKQMQEPSGDAISRETVKTEYKRRLESSLKDEFRGLDLTHLANCTRFNESIDSIPPVPPKPKIGRWIDDKCSVCGKGIEDLIDSREWYRNEEPNFCPFCGLKLVEPQERSDK